MKHKTILFLFVITLFTISSAFSQDDQDSTNTWGKDWKHHKFRFSFFHDEFKGQPTVSLNYGLSKINMQNLSTALAKPNLLELKLGYTTITSDWKDEDIIRYKYKYAYLSNFSTDLSGNNSAGDYKSDMWRFGFGRASGYGYKLGSSAIIPYHAYSIDWTKAKFNNLPANPADQALLEPFDNTFRFGTSMEAGIRFKLVPHFIVEGGYERSIIFPKHLFWKWAGSVIIETAGQVALDKFIDKIMDSSPYAAPIMSFLLKNAFSYGMYELRQSKMNWPFNTAAPLAYNQFKVGVTFVF